MDNILLGINFDVTGVLKSNEHMYKCLNSRNEKLTEFTTSDVTLETELWNQAFSSPFAPGNKARCGLLNYLFNYLSPCRSNIISAMMLQWNMCVHLTYFCSSANAAQAPMPVNIIAQEGVEAGPPPQLAMIPSRDHQHHISPCETMNSAVALGHTSMVGVMPPAPSVHNTQTLLHSLAVSMATLEASCCPPEIQTSAIQQPQISVPIVQKPSFSMHWPSCVMVLLSFISFVYANKHLILWCPFSDPFI